MTQGKVSHRMAPILSLFLYDTRQCFQWHNPYLVTILIWDRAVFPRHGSYLVTILVWHRAVFLMAWLLSCHYSYMKQGNVSYGKTLILSLLLYDTGQCFPWHDSYLFTILVWHKAVFPMAWSHLVTILIWHRAVFPMAWLLSCHCSLMTQCSVSHGIIPILWLFLWHTAMFPMA